MYNDMYIDMFEEAGVVRKWHLMPTAGRVSMSAVWAVASQKGCNCDVHLCHACLLWNVTFLAAQAGPLLLLGAAVIIQHRRCAVLCPGAEAAEGKEVSSSNSGNFKGCSSSTRAVLPPPPAAGTAAAAVAAVAAGSSRSGNGESTKQQQQLLRKAWCGFVVCLCVGCCWVQQ